MSDIDGSMLCLSCHPAMKAAAGKLRGKETCSKTCRREKIEGFHCCAECAAKQRCCMRCGDSRSPPRLRLLPPLPVIKAVESGRIPSAAATQEEGEPFSLIPLIVLVVLFVIVLAGFISFSVAGV